MKKAILLNNWFINSLEENNIMSSNQSNPSLEEYNQTAKKMMDRVTSPQPEEVKERVKAVQKTATKVTNKADNAGEKAIKETKNVAEKAESKVRDAADKVESQAKDAADKVETQAKDAVN